MGMYFRLENIGMRWVFDNRMEKVVLYNYAI